MTEFYLSFFVGIAIIAALAVDLGVFGGNKGELSLRQAIYWSVFWIAFALLFNLIVYFTLGWEPGVEFLSCYLVEKSLSVDNLFVFLLIFNYFKVPAASQRKVLIWGILGALIMRGTLIYLGIQLIESFHWLTYVLGFFLIVTGIKTASNSHDDIDLEHKPILKLLRRYLRVTPEYSGGNFFARLDGKLTATPLLIVLILLETTDVIFALDSIPAILAITQNSFVLYTSNLFAILGLRALYFVLAGLMESLRFLNYGVAFILSFVGAQMLLVPWIQLSEATTLMVITGAIAVSAILSLAFPSKEAAASNAPAE